MGQCGKQIDISNSQQTMLTAETIQNLSATKEFKIHIRLCASVERVAKPCSWCRQCPHNNLAIWFCIRMDEMGFNASGWDVTSE